MRSVDVAGCICSRHIIFNLNFVCNLLSRRLDVPLASITNYVSTPGCFSANQRMGTNVRGGAGISLRETKASSDENSSWRLSIDLHIPPVPRTPLSYRENPPRIRYYRDLRVRSIVRGCRARETSGAKIAEHLK